MKTRVMLIEDEELILQGLKNIIDWEENGYTIVLSAHNGREALAMLLETAVDIIVTDIQMPLMDGLCFLEALRERDKRVRCIILTGYDEFDYARAAIHLDVEDYILKPINEEQLLHAVRKAEEKLQLQEQSRTDNIEENTVWTRFLRGELGTEETKAYTELLPICPSEKVIYPALMKISLKSIGEIRMSDILTALRRKENGLRVIYLAPDTLLLLHDTKRDKEQDAVRFYMELQDNLERIPGVPTFISVGKKITDYEALPESYEEAKKLQKYQVIEGFGSCISPEMIHNRTSQDVAINDLVFRKAIFRKDKKEALAYLEDLFINLVKANAQAEDIYRMALQIAMILREIREEYHLGDNASAGSLIEMVERINQAEDMPALKMVFTGELVDIIGSLSEDNSQYTPVVKQIMSEVADNYREDMNLKTLAFRYKMNASYLGQIFQKEVGCSFAQYLSNTKNRIAKELILNTNMRIHDIAQEVGYADTSYFYRKFKQCYGVSPATLREMKKY